MTDAELQVPGRAGWRSIVLLCVGTLCATIAVYIYLPILAPYAQSLGASLSLVGIISGAYGFTQLLLRMPSGLLSDRWQRRKLFVIAGAACAVVSCLGLSLSQDPRMFVIWRGLAGVAATMNAVNTALFATQFIATQTARAMGFYMFTLQSAFALGPVLGGWSAAAFGWRAPFVLGAVLGVVGLAALSRVWEPPRVPAVIPAWRHRLAGLLRHASVLQSFTLLAVSAFSMFVTTFTFVPILAVRLGAGRAQLGLLVFLTMGTVSLVSLLGGNPHLARLGRQRTIGVGYVIIAVSALALPWVPDLLWLTVAQIASGVGLGLVGPLAITQSLDSIDTGDQATASGIAQSGASLGLLVGPVIGGLLADRWGLATTFIMVGILCLLTAAWSITLGLRSARSAD